MLLQLVEYAGRAFIGPVGEHHHVVTLVLEGFGLERIDDQRPVDTQLFLKRRVAVVPVGAALFDAEAVLVHSIRCDASKTEAGHAVHVGWQQDAVPVDRRILRQAIVHSQRHGVAFTPAQQRTGNTPVDGHRGALAAAEVDPQRVNGQVKLRSGQYALVTGLVRTRNGPHRLTPDTQPGDDASGGQTFDEGTAR